MDEWLSVSQTTPVRIPLSVLFFLLFVFFLSLLARADICAAKLTTWGVGPDVMEIHEYIVYKLWLENQGIRIPA